MVHCVVQLTLGRHVT